MKHLTTFKLIDAIARTGSIRAAAEQASQTPSAVQRRLQSYEQEIGFEIFYRTTKGVRPNAAGELVLHHVRDMLAETERLSGRMADLAGVRRGSISIGCSHALVPYFLPKQIALYQSAFPNVTFDVQVIEHERAGEMLNSYAVDFVLVFHDQSVPDYDVRLAVPQRIAAVMAENHPLAHMETVRLRQCYEYPIALPVKGFAGRALVDRALFGKTFATPPTLQSNSFEFLKAHVASTNAITFQIQIGASGETEGYGTVSRLIDSRDMMGGFLMLGQRHNRTLSVAASRFVEQIIKPLGEEYDLDETLQ